ncbi:exodeoxyribonuclease III [Sorangium sp. So ce1151]|uniref:exodeoxyribonuclease III n=1 Tax=Sorangium sp. So ce1151 TaxID=3133332 RepID=UPI003F60D55F
MRIASWNVNSIRTRLEQLTSWLVRAAPDVVCLQETKVEDGSFPEAALSEAGYRSIFFGQKSYNGVAIAARFGLSVDDVKKGLDGDEEDVARRMLAATIEGVRVINVYVPNGQAVGTPAFAYKLAWLGRLRSELEARYRPDQQLLICGDFNVAPETIDVAEPKKWEGQVLFHPDERAALGRLMEWGLVDAFRACHPEKAAYSWWDYRMGAFRRNKGLRIDLALVTRPLAARCTDVAIDTRPRELQRPSDHAPVVVELADGAAPPGAAPAA